MIDSPSILSSEELARCDRIGSRLRAELEAVLLALPKDVQSVRSLEAHLGINRNVCQRIKASVAKRNDARGALFAAPGVAGLNSFVEAIREKGGDPSLAAAATSAILSFEELIRDLAGSQTKLNARLAIVGGSQKGPPSEEAIIRARRKRFETDLQLLGIGVESFVVLDIFRPVPEDPTQVEHVFVLAYNGVRIFYEGMPIVNLMLLGSGDDAKTKTCTLDGKALKENPTGVVIAEFSSKPLPKVTTRGSGKRSLLVFDPDVDTAAPPFDLAFGRHMSPAGSHPAHDEEPLLVRTITVRYPARRLVNDVWLHKSMAEACQASGDVMFKSNSRLGRRERWYDRLPNAPEVHVSEAGSMPDNMPELPEQEALTRHVFEQLGWDINDFGCFRLHVDYPLTGPEYGVLFDFASQDES